MTWLLALALGGALLLGSVAGLALGMFVMAKVLQDEWRELRELLVALPAPAEPPQEPDWHMRVTPERYLARFPDGIHAPKAREIVERQRRAASV